MRPPGLERARRVRACVALLLLSAGLGTAAASEARWWGRQYRNHLALLRGERPKLTAGTQKWDYLYVEDAARAVVEAVFATRLDGVYNLGSGRAVAVRDIVQTIRDLIDPGLALGFGEIPFKANQIMHLEADIGRLSAAIPWHPTTALADGLERTVSWYRAHREHPAG